MLERDNVNKMFHAVQYTFSIEKNRDDSGRLIKRLKMHIYKDLYFSYREFFNCKLYEYDPNFKFEPQEIKGLFYEKKTKIYYIFVNAFYYRIESKNVDLFHQNYELDYKYFLEPFATRVKLFPTQVDETSDVKYELAKYRYVKCLHDRTYFTFDDTMTWNYTYNNNRLEYQQLIIKKTDLFVHRCTRNVIDLPGDDSKEHKQFCFDGLVI